MRAPWFAVGLIALSVAATSCGDETTAPKPAELAGTWNATKIEYVNRANPSQHVDLIAAGGSATLTLGTDRSFRYIVAAAGDTPDTTSGTYEVKGDAGDLMVWTIPFDGGALEWPFDFSWSGDTMTLSAGANYDFAGDGTPEAADWNMAFRRAP